MSERSMRRARERQVATAQRRAAQRLRRAGLAAGVTIGATAAMTTAAQAAQLTVTTAGDDAAGGVCVSGSCTTLRDAINTANTTAGADTIGFAPAVTGTITLTHGQLAVASADGSATTIQGPGRATLSVSGGNATRILAVSGSGAVSVSGLTLTGGNIATGTGALPGGPSGDGEGEGGALASNVASLTLTDDAVTGNTAASDGGGMYSAGGLTVVRTSLSGNTAPNGGAVTTSSTGFAPLTVTDSQVTGNTATASGSGSGGGMLVGGALTMSGSTVSGNSAPASGGGISVDTGALSLSTSTISGNTAGTGGGIFVSAPFTKYAVDKISQTTITGNTASASGGGALAVGTTSGGVRISVEQSTLSSNHATGASGGGGGVLLFGPESGTFRLIDSTISGNDAKSGGGMAFGAPGNPATFAADSPPSLENSTVAANTAAAQGGGLFLGHTDSAPDPTAQVTSSIVSGNTAAGAANDLQRGTGGTAGGFDLAYSLVQAAGGAPITESPSGSNLLGADPKLGALGDNGGPTKTLLPALGSPVIDRGRAPERLTKDQRDLARTVDGDAANAANGDGTDIGAVERPEGKTVPSPPVVGGTEDAPPTVSFISPAPGATLPSATPTTIAVNAADDHGVARVVFLVGDRPVCTDTTAPFTCSYQPLGSDVGRDTLVAIAADAAGQTATALRTVQVGQFAPKSLSLSASFKRKTSRTVTVRSLGSLSLPTGISRAQACSGTVTVTVKSGSKTLSSRRANVTSSCSYSSSVSLKLAKAKKARTLKTTARFGGNAVLTSTSKTSSKKVK